ncbi:hypothetical protein PACTADRAFT_50999 [Pachysolen tannophilus NRRL Y-2460]|uniref:Uncharacterized protein n=1 Tax=Pachysolen tannophilus NRRL Y-2460 TaxID=669874 RepID=A0A1E4TQU3_PACTA|nr:hypothetical protein PACTADRAFT_50999 [Pachysolen tannophilus NRRL Y-2460]
MAGIVRTAGTVGGGILGRKTVFLISYFWLWLWPDYHSPLEAPLIVVLLFPLAYIELPSQPNQPSPLIRLI